MPKGYKHVTYTERIRIETFLNDGNSPLEVAEKLGRHPSTIYREIKRGQYQHRNSDWTEETRYSPELAQEKHEKACKERGPALKIGNDHKFVAHVEKKILEEKRSPEVILAEIEREQLDFDTKICVSTMYNYIRRGLFLNITMGDMPYKSHIKRRKKKVIKRVNRGESIENRPKEIETREAFGHWEMDTVVGPRGKSKKVFLVLTERKTREEIMEPLKGRTLEEVVRALDRIERSYGEKNFRQIFKTITVDNGTEFSDFERLERSRRNKKKRTKVYYCHPYSSWERGTNENQNRYVRRFTPKGTNFDDVTRAETKELETWINQYPRKMFGFRTPEELFREELGRLAM